MTDLFGRLPGGEGVEAVKIAGHGLSARFLTYGATLQDLRLDGFDHSLVLGFDDLEGYLAHPDLYFGAMVGRYANRIGEGRAAIGGRECQLDRNFLERHLLHGGSEGSSRRNWRIAAHSGEEVTFIDTLPDGHMGFPGRLNVRVTFAVQPGPALSIRVEAETDAETLCNFAHHSYFNLGGGPTVEGHLLQIAADHYLPVTDTLIPTGEVAPVDGMPFDFRIPVRLTADRLATGYDHNFCLSPRRSDLRAVAWLASPDGALSMTIKTSEPGLQFYGGAAISTRHHGPHAGLALEPQIWPDAPNHPHFPSALLRPGEIYAQHTLFAFAGERKQDW
ncbi:aldose epimerase family protein [Telmatospirillum sp. J64-1]|uniref:aldose epimerase family protein n=1 Tax=Telmatospirillum sp. J64-1 TaxID=2502183 RepID=UPI00115C4A19|nr:aldose epimerase family protein [Telmatospirillum sp. J64-1]